jgi:hypothetical protein
MAYLALLRLECFGVSLKATKILMGFISCNYRGSSRNLCNPMINHLARLIMATKSEITFISETKN